MPQSHQGCIHQAACLPSVLSRCALVLALPLLLSACVSSRTGPFGSLAYESLAQFQTPKGMGAIRRHRSDGVFDLLPAPNYNGIPLAGITRVDDVSPVVSPRETAVIIKGATASCANDYSVHIVGTAEVASYRIGDCRTDLKFASDPQGGFVAIQGEGPGATGWTYRPGRGVSGAMAVAAGTDRPAPAPTRPKPAPRPAPQATGALTATPAETPARPKPSPSGGTPGTKIERLDPGQFQVPPLLEAQGTPKQTEATVWVIREPVPK